MSQAQASSSPHTGIQFEELPDTIISDIFVLVWCSRGHEVWRDIHKMRIPYILASVSRRWREVALSTSKIWTFVDISLRAEHLAEHLARSRNLPIEVDLVQDTKRLVQSDLLERLDILKETNSWGRMSDLGALSNCKDMGVFVDGFSSALDDNPTNILQGISIESLSVSYTSVSLSLPRHHTVHHIRLSWVKTLPSCPLPRLQRFKFKNIEFAMLDTLLPFLCLTPNLIDLSLEECRIRSRLGAMVAPLPDTHSILLAELDTLTLSGVEEVYDPNLLFRTLDIPKLRHLSLSFSIESYRQQNNYGWPQAGLDWSAICHSHALQVLELDGLSSEALAGLISCIDQLGQLSALLLLSSKPADSYGQFWWFNSRLATHDEFVGRLAQKLLETFCCPSLSTLDIRFPLQDESREAVKKLGRTRPSMDIHIAHDEPNHLRGRRDSRLILRGYNFDDGLH
ncbi:hypothetical protein FRC09_004497 [Ceratobasidium sp. 395]|nr:hypothetical protein FRC09_004497 [Ceratobasidium sp. 395]